MKKIMLLLNCILSISIANAGVCANTIVDTPDGLKEIKTLQVGDKIFCCSDSLQNEAGAVATVQEIEVPSVVEITTTDGITITVAADQKLFVTHKWVQANQLTLEDVLFKKDRTFVGIKSISHLQKPTTLYFITVDKNPTYWAAENGVLIHNGIFGASVGAFIGKFGVSAIEHGTIYLVSSAVGVLNPAVGFGVGVALEKTCGWAIEAASIKVAIGLGVIGGTLTGPV